MCFRPTTEPKDIFCVKKSFPLEITFSNKKSCSIYYIIRTRGEWCQKESSQSKGFIGVFYFYDLRTFFRIKWKFNFQAFDPGLHLRLYALAIVPYVDIR
jgi:hypothetical protein